MPQGLVRYQDTGNYHFVTFSCYRRRPFLRSTKGRELFERSLETIRLRYGFVVSGYVVMPEHVHLLISEPERAVLAKAIQALKLSVAKQSVRVPFWQARYYDFNVFTRRKFIEKLKYMHRNPVARGLTDLPSSGCGRASTTTLLVRLARLRLSRSGRRTGESVPLPKPTSQNRDVGHPFLMKVRPMWGHPPMAGDWHG